MRITVGQLRRIIRETIEEETLREAEGKTETPEERKARLAREEEEAYEQWGGNVGYIPPSVWKAQEDREKAAALAASLKKNPPKAGVMDKIKQLLGM